MILEFEIPLSPVAKQRARIKRNGFSYTPAKTKNFEESVKHYGINHRPKELIEFPIKLTCEFYISKPKKPKFNLPITRPDLDNYLKSIMDGLNNIIWKDDSCICHVDAKKFYMTDYPKVIVRVEEI